MSNPYEKIVNLLRTYNACYKETVHQPVYTSEQAAIHIITRAQRDAVEDAQWLVRQSMKKLKEART